MHGVSRLYDVIYKARPDSKEVIFLGKVTREMPLEVTAYDLPVPNVRVNRFITALAKGDEVLGVFHEDEAYIIAVF